MSRSKRLALTIFLVVCGVGALIAVLQFIYTLLPERGTPENPEIAYEVTRLGPLRIEDWAHRFESKSVQRIYDEERQVVCYRYYNESLGCIKVEIEPPVASQR